MAQRLVSWQRGVTGNTESFFFFFFVGYFWSESMKNSAVTQFVQREGGESGGGKVSRGCIFK